MERITKDLKHNNSVKSPNSTVNSSRSINEWKKLYNEGDRDDKQVQVDNNKIEVEIYNESKNRPASDSVAEEPTMITHEAVVHENGGTKMRVMHKAPETGKHDNSVEMDRNVVGNLHEYCERMKKYIWYQKGKRSSTRWKRRGIHVSRTLT
ncbi:hypothetical protein EVAR_68830_1 [Eumeta japonica]|uniref:Uncharacterized protein n=1 Tax=Eumeta variegata TaxID=151549 RepID=A0A4C1T5Z8_EUMVA|nr:hypothetical protein EVAR_68830_1 [Eumeta japonica]